MKIFDCCLRNDIPTKEIKAKDAAEAKAIYLEAVILALQVDHVEAIEVDIVK